LTVSIGKVHFLAGQLVINMLVVNDLRKDFGRVRAIDGVSIRVDRGEAVGVIGPNGAGKTTLLNLVAGACSPDQGAIFFNGTDITRYSSFRRSRLGIARTFQVPRPFESLSVFENLLAPALHGAGLHPKAAARQVHDVLDLTGMAHLKQAGAADLSLSQRRLLELGRALAARPTLLLIDEVASGLNVEEFEIVLKILRWVNENGTAMLWIEHSPMMLAHGVRRIVFLAEGKSLFSCGPEEFFTRQEVVNRYLGAEGYSGP
jgi:branched-chain amino acid transport system ATP-binding protein